MNWGDSVTRLLIGDDKVGKMLFCNCNNDLELWKGKKKVEICD